VNIAELGAVEATTQKGQVLSRQTVDIITAAIGDSAQAPSFAEALEIGYRAFAATACAPAGREGVTAFMEKRRPDFEKTG
jgi:enoyl-CoA hydratase/3-hydroxyacyl-CoA dehydrogenase